MYGIDFDMSQEFNRVTHDLLLQKLALDGFSPQMCAYFSSWLSDRRNSFRVDSSYFDEFVSKCGVPQVSILGPLLFLLLINDVVSCVNDAKIILFADDVNLFLSRKSLVYCTFHQPDTEHVSNWCIKNCLTLNPEKSKLILLSRKREFIGFSDILESTSFPRVSFIRDLGVHIGSALFFNEHVSITVNAAFRMLGVISRVCRQSPSPFCVLHFFKGTMKAI